MHHAHIGWAREGERELRRQARVLTSGVFGMAGDRELSEIARRAAELTGFPITAVSIVDRKRLWLAVACGFDPREFDRPNSFCDAAIATPDFAPLCVPDTWKDRRFALAPAVLEMGVRAYFAAPLVTRERYALGTLCLLDQQPRRDVTEATLSALVGLANEAVAVIEREPNAIAYAEMAIGELCARIKFAVADGDEALVDILDDELRRFESSTGGGWQRAFMPHH